MLVCFGAAWPVSIYKSIRTRAVEGKSLPFLIIVFVGYIAGILHKLVFHYDLVIFLYALNAAMVGLDAVLYLRNRLYHIRKSFEDAGDAQPQPGGRHVKVLIAYRSRYGTTASCARALAGMIRPQSVIVDLARSRAVDLKPFDVVLIGGSIYGGKILPPVRSFCERNRETLLERKVGLFICCFYQGEHAREQLRNAFPDWLRERLVCPRAGGWRACPREAHFARPAPRPQPRTGAKRYSAAEPRGAPGACRRGQRLGGYLISASATSLERNSTFIPTP